MSKISPMDVSGKVDAQRAPGVDGVEVNYGPFYSRAQSIKVFEVNPTGTELVTLTRKEYVRKGGLVCTLHEEEGCLKTLKECDMYFDTILLEKVLLEDNMLQPKDDFYPVLKRLLFERKNWGVEFTFRGLSVFVVCLMEWTRHVMCRFEQLLLEADIFGLVAVSQYPYHYNKEVWRAFCELWSSLTNTLHYAGGELGISLYDLKRIGGLPILGEPYEEYLPTNEDLLDIDKHPPTVAELLSIHAKLCRRDNTLEVTWFTWIAHFYRDKQEYFSYGEGTPSSSHRKQPTQPMGKSKKLLPLEISREGELTAFIALLLSRFVLPHGENNYVRPESFVMASLLAQGKKVALAPVVLGHIYHGLGKVATHKANPGSAKPTFGIHFVVGWLAVYFQSLYPCRPDNEHVRDFPLLAQYAGVQGHSFNLFKARVLFRSLKYVIHRAVDFGAEIGDKDHIDSGGLSDLCLEHLLIIRSAILPVRVGTTLILEPYYPNRFARQFGFDQAIPANRLNFVFSERDMVSLEDIARASQSLFRTETGTLFRILPRHCQGRTTYGFCGWWLRVSTPYLAQSCHKVRAILTNKNSLERDQVFIINNVRIIDPNLRGAARVPERNHRRTAKSSLCLDEVESLPGADGIGFLPEQDDNSHIFVQEQHPINNLAGTGSPSGDRYFKRRRRARSDDSDSPRSVGIFHLPFNDQTSVNSGVMVTSATSPNKVPVNLDEAFEKQSSDSREHFIAATVAEEDAENHSNVSDFDSATDTSKTSGGRSSLRTSDSGRRSSPKAFVEKDLEAQADTPSLAPVEGASEDFEDILDYGSGTDIFETSGRQSSNDRLVDSSPLIRTTEADSANSSPLMTLRFEGDHVETVSITQPSEFNSRESADHGPEPLPAPILNVSDFDKLTGSHESQLGVKVGFAPDQELTVEVDRVNPSPLLTSSFTGVSDGAIITVKPNVPSSEPRSTPLSLSPLESIQPSLGDIFPASTKGFLRTAVIESIRALTHTISDFLSSREPLSIRGGVLDDIEALKLMAKAAKVDDIHLSWFYSQTQQFLDTADTLAQLNEVADATPLNETAAALSLCIEELTRYESELSELSERLLAMEERKNEILALKERLHQMEGDFARDKEMLEKTLSTAKDCVRLRKEKRQSLEERVRVKEVESEELNQTRSLLVDISRTLILFASVD